MAEHSTVNRRVTGSSPVGGADIARTPERSSGVLAIYVTLARTSNHSTLRERWGAPFGPSGLRPRRGNGFYFLARSENLRLASSSPVGAFPSTLANQFMKPTPQEKFTPSTRAAPASQTQRGSAPPASSCTYSRANPQTQPSPECYACSSIQTSESRKYLKR